MAVEASSNALTAEVSDELLADTKESANLRCDGAMVLETLWQYVHRDKLARLSGTLSTVDLGTTDEQMERTGELREAS